ncbi:MAG TPA: 16S rRNA (guanine(527)-N(7))-methyltransferase RsmG [Anaeromyxobacteraceae bacterium]|nr:16S rRNA (guanine(527)-N(7))-methyltransferase RsmG [Anaeromyxobacteraceae bacterium]
MDRVFEEALRRGLEALGLAVGAAALERLGRYADRLLAWNRKLNLTAVTDPSELAERHLVDSLALLPEVEGARTLLDVGSGAGLPGVPLAIARPDLEVVCCDAVAKKVSFLKAVAAELDLRVRAVAVRAAGRPGPEGLPLSDRVVSRAVADPERWLPLGRAYVAPGGTLLAMLGREADEGALGRAAGASGLELVRLRRFELPLSGARRAVATLRVASVA